MNRFKKNCFWKNQFNALHALTDNLKFIFMRIFSLILFILFLIACNNSTKTKTKCIYTINDLFKDYDSTKFQIVNFEKETEIKIFTYT